MTRIHGICLGFIFKHMTIILYNQPNPGISSNMFSKIPMKFSSPLRINFMKTHICKNVIGVQFLFSIFQSLGDYTDGSQAVAVYILVTSSLCVFTWLGNELTTHVCISGNHRLGFSFEVFFTPSKVCVV